MLAHRASHQQLGFIDCVAGFTVSDAGPAATPWSVQVTFEEFAVADMRESSPADADRADFTLEAPLAVWRDMIESIAAGNGRPALQQTLNYLSHMGSPIALRAADPLRRDLYFRYNQSLQEFINASASFRTLYG